MLSDVVCCCFCLVLVLGGCDRFNLFCFCVVLFVLVRLMLFLNVML